MGLLHPEHAGRLRLSGSAPSKRHEVEAEARFKRGFGRSRVPRELLSPRIHPLLVSALTLLWDQPSQSFFLDLVSWDEKIVAADQLAEHNTGLSSQERARYGEKERGKDHRCIRQKKKEKRKKSTHPR